MKSSDRNLGMDRPISRRDLLLGVGASAASAFVPGRAFADEMFRLEGTSEQKIAGRHELFATSYETIERNIRRQLAGSLSAAGFDPARDIEAITVNRWAHAYINRANPLYDEMYEDREDERYPFVRGRKPFGRVAIANSDAGSSSLINVAIDQAYRAVNELV